MNDGLRRTIEYYNVNADSYSEKERSTDISRQADTFLGMVQPGARILDAGCGSGRDARYFSERGLKAIGIDLSPSLLEMARKYAPKATFLRMDMCRPAFKEKSFEGLWMSASILHLPRKEATHTLLELSELVQGNSPLYISVLAGKGEETVYFDKNTERTFIYYSANELASLVNAAGFDIISIKPDVRNVRTWLDLYAKKA
jgi:SAM-dependent methyltransferase